MSLLALSDEALQQLLRDEAPYGDLSTMSLGLGDQPGSVTLAAKQPMTVCGCEEAARLFELCGAKAHVLSPSGRHVPAGTQLLGAHGPASTLLRVWPLARTLIADTSGLASEVARIVTELRAAGHTLPLACTAQVFPGTRALMAKAVHSGGGTMYRLNLSDSLVLTPAQRVFMDATLDDTVAACANTIPSADWWPKSGRCRKRWPWPRRAPRCWNCKACHRMPCAPAAWPCTRPNCIRCWWCLVRSRPPTR